MTPEEKALLERVATQVSENNEILKSVRLSQRWSFFMKVAYWALILILSFGAYFFIQPYLTFMNGVSGGMKNDVSQVRDLLDGI